MIIPVASGTSLNFKVVGGTSEPANPKENTIWVNTDAEITGWGFSASAPTNPAEGMIWFQTGTSSPAAFNALKKNGIAVYPNGCKQYVSGAWVAKTAKTYQNSTWQEWRVYLFRQGDAAVSMGVKGSSYSVSNGIVSFKGNGTGWHCTWFSALVDLTNAETICVEGSFNESPGLAIWRDGTSIDSNSPAAQVTCSSSGAVLDVSSFSGMYYVGFKHTYTTEQKVYNCWYM